VIIDFQRFNVLACHCIIHVRRDPVFKKCFVSAATCSRNRGLILEKTNQNIQQQLIKIFKMKKTILSLAIGLAAFSSAFAKAPDSANDRAVASFQKDFHQASAVRWDVTNNYVMATFELDKQIQYAYYDFQGNLIGVVRHMLTSSLPEDLNKEIKKHYANYWVSELFQVTSEHGVYYYIQLKNGDETLVLSTEDSNGWHRFAVPKN
jgi:hypothetical protein